MGSHLTLRIQFGPHQPADEITEQLLRLVRAVPVDEIMFFFFGEEQNDGHETLERLDAWIERSRPYREALRQAGVALSLNPWHTVLHCDRGRRLKPGQDWQRMVDPEGREAQAVVCPLDPGWQRYYLDTLRKYAAEGFRTVWIDDDIRYHNHGPLEWGGCFCPLHVAEFNRRTGAGATREAIVAACLQPGAPHPWRSLWLDLWQDTQLPFLDRCRQVLEAGGARMGLMSSTLEAHAAEGRRWKDWWRTFGGGKPPVHRPHFWSYGDTGSLMVIHGIGLIEQNRSIQPAAVDSGPEIENFPYGVWNKSFRQTFAQLCLAQLSGSTHLNISLYDFMGNLPDDDPSRADFLKRVRPTLDWLSERFPARLTRHGVGVPWHEDMGRAIRTSQGRSWRELHCPTRGWCTWLGAAGLSFTVTSGERLNALAGPVAWAFDDQTLQRWLAAGLLLDGAAAAILAERGFGRWIGIRSARVVTQDEVLYSVEECRDPAFCRRAGAQISVNSKPHARSLLQAELEPDATIISELLDPLQRRVGHGAFLFQNELGGRVAVVPWEASQETVLMDLHRAFQLRRIVDWLAAHAAGAVEGGAWLVPQFFSEEGSWRAVVWNAGPDAVGELRLRRPSGMPALRNGWHLTPDGARHPVAPDGDTLRLDPPLHQWELLVLE